MILNGCARDTIYYTECCWDYIISRITVCYIITVGLIPAGPDCRQGCGDDTAILLYGVGEFGVLLVIM